MKAEERKVLQKNDLAAGIEKLMSGVTEGPSKNTVMYTVLTIVAIALVVTMIWTWKYFANQSEVADADRWEELNRINSTNAWSVNADDLKRFAEDKNNVGTAQARVARFELARFWSQSDRDLANSFPDRRNDAITNVKKGRDLYVELIEDAREVPDQVQEALMGAAKGSETLGDIDQARKYYERLNKDYPQSSYGKNAAKQLDRLNNSKDLDALKKLLEPKRS
jgi:hypothetical protein